jgi:hypothetical protein
MKRLLHRLFRRHRFEPYELFVEPTVFADEGTMAIPVNPELRVWYIGYVCACGEPGYATRFSGPETPLDA